MGSILHEMAYSMPIFKSKAANHSVAKETIVSEIKSTPQYGIKSPTIQLTDCDWHLGETSPKPYWPPAFEALSPCIAQSAKDMEFCKWEIGDHWYQWYEQGDYHSWHTHGNSMFVGVYYVSLPPGSPSIEFNWQGEQVFFPVEEGDVVIFPAYLSHRAPVNNSLNTKVIVSFNLNYR